MKHKSEKDNVDKFMATVHCGQIDEKSSKRTSE
jgi:hypothetical protein